MYLYIKPVLKDVTIRDVDKYIEIIKQYNISTVVGEFFSTDGDILAPIAEGKLFYDNKQNDYNMLVDMLSEYCDIFQHSTEAIIQGIADG
ncbi:MAG: hypothetical protein FAF04_04980 [Epsilonproteobacteria bacterium]|nr:hypothetical protein [Campylobacterota bacterium]